MTREYLKECIETGREIEFEYDGNEYSITYVSKNNKDIISFCQFYEEPINVENFEELLKITWKGKTVLQIWESLTEKDRWTIY